MRRIQRQDAEMLISHEESNDIFGIELDSKGNKMIHFYGFIYYSGEPGNEYRLLEYTYAVFPLKEFLKYDSILEFSDYHNSFNDYKQYISDISQEEAIETYLTYDHGSPPKLITKDELDEDIPCGVFVQNTN